MQDIEIKKIISMIDQKIKSLENAKEVLIREFGGEEQILTSIPKPDTRKEVVMKLIQKYGSLSRKEILEKTDMPSGTLAYVLNDKSLFCNRDGKWNLVSKEGEKEKSAPVVQEDRTGDY